ncbi:unnamed protein product [Brassicogethes aeneus]|uniref:Protein unzipped n=1 Tax=Brassicogethes aeneus TaxID=1431903 RepID=A0A9P0FH29_BRAAE|nr:unnamed protein product [Brassicogethes aeneus]
MNFLVIVLIGLIMPFSRSEPYVHILSENLDQVVTSTTLQWYPASGINTFLLQNAVVGANQTLKGSVSYDDTSDESVSTKPVYICRAKANGIWVTGQLRLDKNVCIVSHYNHVNEEKNFEILINIENSARLSWVYRDKYTLNPQGAVCSDEQHTLFIARRKAKVHGKGGSLSYYVGIFDSTEDLGVFHLVDQNNNEIEFEDGEILVESEPVRYEFKSLRFVLRRSPKKKTILGKAILKNEVEGLQRVESVISYNYTHFLSWGKGHGLLTGLPFTVHLNNGTSLKGKWGISESAERIEMAPIERYLETGTAVNVTLIGNYTETDVPYTATVVAIYKDEKRREWVIHESKREKKMDEVYANFDPLYFIHNNSHVPTTTTTTSTTTTTTTSKTTTTTQEANPISLPPQVIIIKQGEGSLKKEKNDILLDDSDSNASSLMKNPAAVESSTNRNVIEIFLLASVMAILRLT